MKKFIVPAVFFLSLMFSGCDPDSPFGLMFNSPDCKIISRSQINIPDFGFATMEITVKNVGGGPTAFDIGCFIKLKYGDHIVDVASTGFGTLEEDESITQEAWFMKLKSNMDYSYMEISLYWYDAEGNYYEEIY